MLDHLRGQKEIPLNHLVGLMANCLTMKTIDDQYAEQMPIIQIEHRRYRVSNFKRKLSR